MSRRRERENDELPVLSTTTTKELEDEERSRDLSAPSSQQWRMENEEFIYSLNSS
jgi:hypothetical protein